MPRELAPIERILILTAWYPSRWSPLDGTFVRDHTRAWQKHAAAIQGNSCRFATVKLAYSLDCLNIVLRGRRLQREIETTAEGLVVHEQPLRFTNRIALGERRAERQRLLYAIAVATRELGGVPDLVVAQTLSAAMWASEMRIECGYAPIIFVEHSNPLSMHMRTVRRRRRCIQALAAVSEIVVVGARQRRDFASLGHTGAVTVIPNPVPEEFFASDLSGPTSAAHTRLVTVARLSTEKGIERLITAMSLLPDRAATTLDIIGDGELRPRLELLSASFQLQERVRFHGALPRDQIATSLAIGGIFVLPSLWENCPVALLEAQASGVPCIVTRNGGSEEVLLRGNGLAVSNGEDAPAALAAAVRTIASAPEKFPRHEIRARAEREFSERVFASRCFEVFRRPRGETWVTHTSAAS